MIYEYPDRAARIRQGDIFCGLPRVEVSLRNVIVYTEGEEQQTRWTDIATANKRVAAILPIEPVFAIVVTQDCDTLRSPDITLCEIRKFQDVLKIASDPSSPSSWFKLITQQTRVNQKWFYLPPDEAIGLTERMAVDFLSTIRVPREHLEELRYLRKGRLSEVADEHFRERLAEFYRRYPYNEWYPLNKEEYEKYKEKYPEADPYPWQKP